MFNVVEEWFSVYTAVQVNNDEFMQMIFTAN